MGNGSDRDGDQDQDKLDIEDWDLDNPGTSSGEDTGDNGKGAGTEADEERGRFEDVEIPEEVDGGDGLSPDKLKLFVVATLVVVATAYVGGMAITGGGVENPETRTENGLPENSTAGSPVENRDSPTRSTGDSETEDTAADGENRQEDKKEQDRNTVVSATPPETDIEALRFDAGARGGRQLIRLKNTGEEVPTSEINVSIEIPEASASVSGLPTNRIDSDRHVTGDNIFDYSYAGVAQATEKEVWADDELVLRIKHGGDGRKMEVGEAIEAKVRHIPSGETLYSETVVAE